MAKVIGEYPLAGPAKRFEAHLLTATAQIILSDLCMHKVYIVALEAATDTDMLGWNDSQWECWINSHK